MKKRLIFIGIFIIPILAFAVWGLFDRTPPPVKAGATNNVSGWAWSENIGWLSFNCTNEASCAVVDYGVNIGSDGTFSGYAWSENIGWIKFNPTGPYPEEPQHSAKMDLASGEVSGWARACAGVDDDGDGVPNDCQGPTRTDGWDGWIKMAGPDYGVSFNPSKGAFEGWAWGSDVVGWISFNCENCVGTCDSYPTCGDPNHPDYKVITSFNLPPQPPSGLSEILNPCAWGMSPQVAPGLSILLSWNYSDPENDSQIAYEIFVDDDSDFSGARFNHQVNSAATSYVLDLSQDDDGDWLSTLEWGTTYYWAVRVKDSGSQEWSPLSTDSFTTPSHAYPYPEFTVSPTNPSVDEVVEFVDTSSCYDESGGEYLCKEGARIGYEWDFDYIEPDFTVDDATKGNATTTYSQPGPYTVRLRITDESLTPSGVCTKDESVNVSYSLPEWKEVAP